MVFVTRKEHFNAAHKLYRPDWTEEKNKEIFGPCANPNWHGHNYDLLVTVKGNPDPETGFVVDLKKLSTLIREKVVARLDHKNLNMDVDFMRGKMASTEILAIEIWKQLEQDISQLGDCRLHSIRIFETERNFIDYFGE